MQHCLTHKASSQGHIWYSARKTNMVRLRIGLHGNHSALSNRAASSSTSELNSLDQYYEILHDRLKSKRPCVERLDYLNENHDSMS